MTAPTPLRPVEGFATRTTGEIMATTYPPLMWVVPGFLAEGLTILGGRQKLGKTWLAVDIGVAVAIGGVAMGSIACERGDVLYLDMENGERRIQRRIDTLFPDPRTRPNLDRLQWATSAPELGGPFFAKLDVWRRSVPEPRLVVIDVLQRVKPAGTAARNAYENDYGILAGLQQWAVRNGVAVLCLHHTRKGGADDPLEALSGSNGLSACADTTLILDRDQNGVTLYVRGRDIEEREAALKFDAGRWFLLGEAEDVRRTDERRAILDVLAKADEALGPKDIAEALDLPEPTIRVRLHRMSAAGDVVKEGRGRYVHPDRESYSSVPP